MDAKEWLIEQGFSENTAYLDCVTKEGFGYPLELLMERYKDNQMEEVHSKIMSFRENYLQHWSKLENNEAEFALYLLDQFDLHFNLREI